MGQFFSKAGIFNPAQLRFTLKVKKKKKKATWSVMLSNKVELFFVFFLFVFFETEFFCVVLAGLELTKIRLPLTPECRH